MSAIAPTYDIDMDKYENGPTVIEFLDYIPLVSTITGMARFIFGCIQALVGLVIFPIELCGRVMNLKSSFVLLQGIANIVRGVIAAKPIIGNIILYIYDHSAVLKRDIRRAAGLEV